jgi:sugar phosphate isomerase/epimerase
MVRIFSTLGCPEATLDEALALAARQGLDGVELRALGGTTDLPAYLRAQFGSPSALADRLRGQGRRIVALGTSLRAIGGTASDREQFLEFLPWAEALGVPWLRVFDGGRTGDAAELAQVADTLRWWRDLRAARAWRADLMLETHDVLAAPATLRAFLAAQPDAAILWDSHHTWRKFGEDPVVTWRSIHARVVHVHVKDSVAVAGPRLPYTYVRPGEGEFPMAPLLAELRARFAGAVSLEWEKLWHPSLPPLPEALAAAAANRWW